MGPWRQPGYYMLKGCLSSRAGVVVTFRSNSEPHTRTQSSPKGPRTKSDQAHCFYPRKVTHFKQPSHPCKSEDQNTGEFPRSLHNVQAFKQWSPVAEFSDIIRVRLIGIQKIFPVFRKILSVWLEKWLVDKKIFLVINSWSIEIWSELMK